MFSLATFISTSAFVTTALAAVVDRSIEARQGPSFYLVVCRDAYLANGSCLPVGVVEFGACINFVEPYVYNDSISSFASTYAPVACTLFVDPDCQGASIVAKDTEATEDLSVSNPELDNALSSYYCIQV